MIRDDRLKGVSQKGEVLNLAQKIQRKMARLLNRTIQSFSAKRDLHYKEHE